MDTITLENKSINSIIIDSVNIGMSESDQFTVNNPNKYVFSNDRFLNLTFEQLTNESQ